MPLWFDNVGIHCLGRVIERRAIGRVDIDGFLQFATFLIFADSIAVNNYESDQVASRSKEVRDYLLNLEVPGEAFAIANVSRNDYLLACEQAATVAAECIDRTFDTDAQIFKGMMPEMPAEETWIQLEIPQLIGSSCLQDEVDRLGIEEHFHLGNLAVLQMLARNDSLRTKVQQMIGNKPKWSEAQTACLDGYLRSFLNENLARQHDATYAPSVIRAKTIRLEKKLVLDLLFKQIDAVTAARTHHSTSLPSLSRILLARGCGEPEGIISASLEIREETRPLRIWISRLTSKMEVDPVQGYFEASCQVEELGRDLATLLKLSLKETHIGGEITKWTLDSMSFNVGRATNWLRSQWNYERVMVLSEISKEAAYPSSADADYEHLLRTCIK